MTDLRIYMDAVAEVARIAGDIAKRHYGRSPETRTKNDGSPVTVADINAERAARQWIEQRFPDDGIIGEELPPVRPGAARRWILDPIDGTYTFLQTVPLWGTLVAVAEADSVIAGAAYFPALDEIIFAAPGEGCWWNGTRAAVSTVAELGKARLVTTDARFIRDPARRERWMRLQDGARSMRTWGDCYGYLLVATGRADIMVENYRPGAFEALGLGYEALLKINPRLIYCSISAFGQDGVRREQTAYDHVIQATSGIMASTGTEEVNPIKIGAPAVDYATGTMGAFALASALFQRERTGKGQHIDLAMLGVAMMMQASLMTGYFRNGTEPKIGQGGQRRTSPGNVNP